MALSQWVNESSVCQVSMSQLFVSLFYLPCRLFFLLSFLLFLPKIREGEECLSPRSATAYGNKEVKPHGNHKFGAWQIFFTQQFTCNHSSQGLLPCVGYINIRCPKGYGFFSRFSQNKVSILAILVSNRVWCLPCSLEFGMLLEEAILPNKCI